MSAHVHVRIGVIYGVKVNKVLSSLRRRGRNRRTDSRRYWQLFSYLLLCVLGTSTTQVDSLLRSTQVFLSALY